MNSASLAGGVVEDNDALRLDEIRILVGVVMYAMRLDGRVCITGASSFEGIGSCLLGVLEMYHVLGVLKHSSKRGKPSSS